MIYGIIVWSFVYLTEVGIVAQGILPSQCHGILMNGSTLPYDVTSIAGTFQRFCSQRRYISQCMVDNKDQMISSDNPISWAIGLVFEKSVFDTKSNTICQRLADVASELECILSETDVSCGSGFSESIPNIFSLHKANNITDEEARGLICSTIHSTAYCYKSGLKPCIEPVKDFMAAYNLVFSGQCTRAIVRNNLYKSAMFSCTIESFPDIINNNIMETDSTTQELNRKNVSSTDSLRVYANQVLHFCTNAEKFIECLHETVPMSDNAMDKILTELMDFSNKENLGQIVANICSKILDDIKSHINCIIPGDRTSTNIPMLFNCSDTGNRALLWSASEDTILSTSITGQAVRSTFCKPIEELMTCVKGNFYPCNPNVAVLVNDLMNSLLRTDCDEKSQAMAKNSALNYSHNNFRTTVFVTTMLLLTAMHLG